MNRAYSNDLGERVVAAGESCRVAVARFGVSVLSVVKWSQRWRATGSVSPDKMGGFLEIRPRTGLQGLSTQRFVAAIAE